MDDKSSSPFSSFVFSIFKPFIHSYRNEIFIPPENDKPKDELDVPSGASEVSPRDLFLKPDPNKKPFKNPYSNRDGRQNTFIWGDFGGGPNEEFYSVPNEDFGMDRNDEMFGDFYSPGFHDGNFESLFRRMNEMFEKSMQFNFGFFGDEGDPHRHNFPHFPHMPSIEPKTDKSERIDKDLDDSSGKEITSLLKDSPSFERRTESHPLKESPSMGTSRFKSTSIVRIRRPDGVIEETRKYRDSDGREETEIITREPGSEDNAQSVEPFTDPSFTGIFKKFPFTIF